MPNNCIKFVRFRSLGRSATLRAPYASRWAYKTQKEIHRLSITNPSLFIRVLKIVLSRFGRVIVSGTEHLDGAEGKVVVCNHVGWADPLWVGYSALPRTLHQMAKKELFDNPVIGWFVRSGGGFPIDRSRPSAATIKQVISLVQQGKHVLIFPNGTRTRNQTEAKRGAATIALHANAAIVPAHYEGPEYIRLIHLFRRPTIRVTFGAPIVPQLDAPADKEAALSLTSQLDNAMSTLVSSRFQNLCPTHHSTGLAEKRGQSGEFKR